MKHNYLNFYGNLMKSSDAYLMKLLGTLESRGLLDNTLVIATADHGEMGTSHTGTRPRPGRVDYSDQILSRSPKPSQDDTVFTYDDFQSGQSRGPFPAPLNHIVSIREQRYKLARYYDADGNVPDQWELYDLKIDPLERSNLADKNYQPTPAQEREYRRLRRKLADVERTRLNPLS